jgi:hypothetical protein
MIGQMTGIRPSTRRRAHAWVAAAIAVALPLAGALAAGSPIPDLKLPPRPRGDPPMRILRVTSSDPACRPNCPEWISAEGVITRGTAPAFAKILADLGGRRLPLLISSHGGSVGDALAMGQLVRAKGLAVAVARTLIADCPERARDCPNARGQAIVGGAYCASACPLILAGGVERLVGPVPLIGVHQITTVMKEVEGVEHLTTIRKFYEQDWIDERVKDYLTAMGIGDPVMTLLRKTPAGSIRWLSLPEIVESHLATEALDAASPVLTSGANGLNGHVFDGDPPRPDLIEARASAPIGASGGGAGATLEAAFGYRRGGGELEIALGGRAAGAKAAGAPEGWTLTLGPSGEVLPLKAAGPGPPRALLARERFCALGRDGRLVAVPPASASAGAAPREPVTFDLAAMDGAKALTDEACP